VPIDNRVNPSINRISICFHETFTKLVISILVTSKNGKIIPVGVNKLTQPIAAAKDVTDPDNSAPLAEATAGPITGNIAEDKPDDDGIKIVKNEITKKISKIVPTLPTVFSPGAIPLAIIPLNPESVNVIAKPFATATMNATPMNSRQPV
jgi:hypothetical protein